MGIESVCSQCSCDARRGVSVPRSSPNAGSLAPDILEETRSLSPFLSGAGVVIGFLLWSLGGRTHRFWLAMSVTLAAGLLGLAHGKEYGMQPLVAALLLAVSAGGAGLVARADSHVRGRRPERSGLCRRWLLPGTNRSPFFSSAD